MAGANGPKLVIPKPQTAKVFGALNIVFGALMLLCVSVGLVAMLLMPLLMPYFEQLDKNTEQQLANRKQMKVDDLRRQEKAAADPAERDRLRALREQVEAEPLPQVPKASMSIQQVKDPRIRGYAFVEQGVYLVLNLLLVISGVSLLALREWGRRLSVQVAWAKLAASVSLLAWWWIFVLPISTAMQAKQMPTNMPGLPAFFSAMLSPQGLTTIAVASQVSSTIFAAIYPVLTLVMLTSPEVRAACRTAGSKSAAEPQW